MTTSSAPVGSRRGEAGHSATVHSRRTVIFGLVSTLGATLLGALLGPMIILPTVTAETRLVVGDQTLKAQKVPGYVVATVALAETYARFITKDTIRDSESGTLSDVQATVIPDNPIVRIEAKADNAHDALMGAATAAQALIESVSQVSGSAIDRTRQTFLEKRAAYTTIQMQVDSLKAEIAAPGNASDELRSRYEAALTTLALAQLESDAYGMMVQDQLAPAAEESTGLTIIMKPQVSSTENEPMLMGALLGGALAVLGWGSASMIRQAHRHDRAQVPVSD